MSYKPSEREDSLNAYFSRLSDFMRVVPHLLECDNADSFLIWFEKLRLIAPRALFFYMRRHKEYFIQYITSGKVKEVHFTGMFTYNQGDLSVHYYDPESGRIRLYAGSQIANSHILENESLLSVKCVSEL